MGGRERREGRREEGGGEGEKERGGVGEREREGGTVRRGTLLYMLICLVSITDYACVS